jgi:Tol biopolymer transport system component
MHGGAVRAGWPVHAGSVVAVMIGLACVALVGSSPASATFPGHNGKIAFDHKGPGGYHVYTMKPDGTHKHQLTHDPNSEEPSFSANGKRIAFDSARVTVLPFSEFDVFTMKAGGSDQLPLTDDPAFDVNPAFSPSGEIAFDSYREGDPEIWLMNSDGSGEHRLTDNAAGDAFTATFSPNGKGIAFTSFRDGDDEIFAMRANGTHLHRLTNNSTGDALPDFSPSGKEIIFTRFGNTSPHPRLYVMRADGTHQRKLLKQGSNPAFSPNGKKVSFERHHEILVMRANGTHVHQLTHNSVPDSDPSWGVRP